MQPTNPSRVPPTYSPTQELFSRRNPLGQPTAFLPTGPETPVERQHQRMKDHSAPFPEPPLPAPPPPPHTGLLGGCGRGTWGFPSREASSRHSQEVRVDVCVRICGRNWVRGSQLGIGYPGAAGTPGFQLSYPRHHRHKADSHEHPRRHRTHGSRSLACAAQAGGHCTERAR